MKISVLEHGLFDYSQDNSKTYNDVLELCKYAQDLNYYSFWISEQHDVGSLVISSPLILLNHLANKTDSIKLGCGGIMLKHYPSFNVAEQINTLNLLHPNRFIFGFGSNAGTEKVKTLFNTVQDSNSYYQKLLEVVTYTSKTERNFLKVNPHINKAFTPVMLITSEESAIFAAQNGFKINYGWFLNPSKIYASAVINTYIDTYKKIWGYEPTDIGLSVNVVSGENTESIDLNAKLLALFRHNFNAFEFYPTKAILDQYVFDEDSKKLFDKFYRNVFKLSSVEDVKMLDDLCTQLKVDHLMVLPTMQNLSDRKRALKLVAQYFKNRNGDQNEKDY
ncbi:MsnO8 family LLM class oxidoreductase [Mycoplasma simbae]|uniref:MsnO8 family LLM class oxidoreductase n=1 Tax=Mycoplasma simbae TaxID=36744 RepID=UPI0004964CE8|nr:MsnO8 family LLM class oxidoreductase [Mycoplasma simbae]